MIQAEIYTENKKRKILKEYSSTYIYIWKADEIFSPNTLAKT